jgi:hypothetical protein
LFKERYTRWKPVVVENAPRDQSADEDDEPMSINISIVTTVTLVKAVIIP